MSKAVLALALLAIFAANIAAQSSCIINKRDYPPDGPSDKNCNRCQWQALTDQQVTTAVMNGTVYNRTALPTFNCGDGYFDRPRNGTINGLCVMLNATGAIIDTQEQGCKECTAQCFWWSECTTMIYNYVVVPKTANLLSYCPVNPIFPGAGPSAIPLTPLVPAVPGGRKLLAN